MMKYMLAAIVSALGISALAQPPTLETTIGQQTDIAVTAYNNGIALVRDVRTLQMPTGELQLKFSDVAQQIRPETVGLRSLAQEGSVGILEQNYEYDLISPEKLMEKYVGKQVTLKNFSTEVNMDSMQAELLSVNGGPVYKGADGQIYIGHPGQVVLPAIPDNLISKPSLIWQLNNAAAAQTLEATYLTNGVSWSADYVLTLAKTDASLDIAGWVTLNNQSGATYKNAQLKLVAGQVNVAPQVEAARDMGMVGMGGGMAMAAPMPKEEAFAEYHLYTIPRRTTIKENQSKQVALLSGAGVACGKRYEYRGQEYFYSQQIPPMPEEKVDVFLEFQNKEDNHLGIPLPEGVMRIYQEDSDGMLQFAGEDRIKHTPKDEKVKLRMGQAFDVVAERVQTDYKVIAPNVWESAYAITLRNHKESDVTVDVVEPMPGDWRIIEKSQDFVKKDARTAIFTVLVPKDGEVKITYRVQVSTANAFPMPVDASGSMDMSVSEAPAIN